MDRLIALEKLMMSCQDKDRLGVLKDVAQSRKEIQVRAVIHLFYSCFNPFLLCPNSSLDVIFADAADTVRS